MEAQQLQSQRKSKSTECESKYTNLLIKHIYRWSRIESNKQINSNGTNNHNISKMKEITDLINQIDIDFKNGRYPDENDDTFHKTFNQLFTKFIKEKFGNQNKENSKFEFYKKCLTLYNKFVHQKTDKTDKERGKEKAPKSPKASSTSKLDTATTSTEQIPNNSTKIETAETQTVHEGERYEESTEDTIDTNKQNENEEQINNEISQRMKQATMSTNTKVNTKRPERILVMIDWDDTLIPSTIIKQKKFRVSEMNTTDKEREELDEYAQTVNTFMNKLLKIFDGNKENNIKIVTNASSMWVSEGSFCRTGPLFAKVMRSFNEKLAEAKINIISAHDHNKKHQGIFSQLAVREYKRYLMRWIYYDHFGMKIRNLDEDIKIISIGDSSMEFKASEIALNHYLNEQSPDVLNKNKINVTLQRVKFRKKPSSFKQLSDELKWCIDNIHDIVYKNDKSRDYYL